MSTFTLLVTLFAAGGLGTLSRFGLNQLAWSVLPRDFPFGTTGINAIGCLLFGVVMGLTNAKVIPGSPSAVILVGFLGAFTTFSTFAFEAHSLMANSRWVAFTIYLAVQNVLGILFIGLGLRLVQ